MKKTICVGISGGVDSSVSAALLSSSYDVHGVFIKVWQPEFIQCTWKDEHRDAMRVAATLEIPFHTLDAQDAYKQGVVDYMISQYKAGRTPNPDVMCNKYVKFGEFLSWAQVHGANAVATGHYAQKKMIDGQAALYTATDTDKDQSYFLWTLTQKQLSHIEFPIGHLTKPHVRKLAQRYNLPTATKKDSQGLCFIGHVDMKEFLKEYISTTKGSVLNEQGTIIGTHDGALLYTLGERHGFTITTKTPDSERLFVIDRDLEKNTITVGTKKQFDEYTQASRISLSDTNWIRLAPNTSETLYVRTRYRQALVPCNVDGNIITLHSQQSGISLGQSAVIYRENGECIGGGIIEKLEE